MNNLAITQSNLPDTLEDLSKFVLVGREKLTAVRAYIKAIDKLEVAEEVRNQKREEAQMLGEALLDAEVRIGDLLKQIPKASGGDRKSENFKNDIGVDFEKPINIGVDKLRTKKQVIEDLGFNQKQAERFETLASNKEIVEQVKAEARENEDIPTRSRVIQLVNEKKKQEELQQNYETYCDYVDDCHKAFKKYFDATHKITEFEITDEFMDQVAEFLESDEDWEMEIQSIDMAIHQMNLVKNYLIKKPKRKGVKKYE